MKRRRIKTWVKILFIIIIAVSFIKVINCFKAEDEKAIEKCQQENSLEYCYKIIYGN